MSKNSSNFQNKQNAPAFAGIILLIIGFIWLLGEMNINLPNWVMQPYTFLIGIGIYLGAKKNFQAPFGWMIPLGIGAFWMSGNLFNINVWRFGFPMALIGAGIFIIINGIGKKKELPPTNTINYEPSSADNDNIAIANNAFGDDDVQVDRTTATEPMNATEPQNNKDQTTAYNAEGNDQYNNDVLDATAIFSGIDKMVTSKKFKGGDIVAVMGGVDINLSFADIQSPVIIDVTIIMGGLKLIVPAGWEVKNNITSILGGVEERRPPMVPNEDKKLLVLKGTVIMGGVDIRNY
jgi:hypothetical protein